MMNSHQGIQFDCAVTVFAQPFHWMWFNLSVFHHT